MMKQEERVAHLPKRWATSSRSCRDAGIPSVFPAKAGIHVASPGLYARGLAQRHTVWRDTFDWREWASAAAEVTLRLESNLLFLRIVGTWFPAFAGRTISLKK